MATGGRRARREEVTTKPFWQLRHRRNRSWWPKLEIFSESEKEFFLKVVDAQITFVADARGKATELILHQNGMEHTGKRID